MEKKMVALGLEKMMLENEENGVPVIKASIKKAAGEGVCIVPYTERNYASLPIDFLFHNGFQYVITSEGAETRYLKNDVVLTSSYLRSDAVKEIQEVLRETKPGIEITIMGRTFVERKIYNADAYFLRRRNNSTQKTGHGYVPVMGVPQLLDVHKHTIAKITLTFIGEGVKNKALRKLKTIRHISIDETDRFVEIKSDQCSYQKALKEIGENLGFDDAVFL